ncbi:Pkinase-domain-containing protein [Melanomma pulvis-pyrius CBS 109.77]|uniref:Pkinase-domain-containing protein n=1 Tax=Melanomma pulvis-pyrius CBS 109.77 TaxID=1314802 RepID=A0A6A6WU49_9PLEO|nr:Pkinase-domain-containing protein [Melanomma pulvis-pyrius CBS 109.77]
MPSVAPAAPAFVNPFTADPADVEAAHRRDSRLVEFSAPIPEEDESTETASEPPEPTTPRSHSSDNTPFSHPFRHDDPVEGIFIAQKSAVNDAGPKPLPNSAPTVPTQDAPPAPVTRTMSNLKSAQSDQSSASPPDKPGLGKRVGSFVRNKLHRTPSNKDGHHASHVPPEPMKTEKVLVKTGVDGPAEVSAPALNIPKYRRLSSFSLSARNSPRSSHGNSPPSPSSPTSTISDEHPATENRPNLGHKHSASSAALSSMNSKKPGITWAGGGRDGKKSSRFTRRRSASSEQVPRIHSSNGKETVGLIDTFSKPAAEGVGMKARRLSLSLPDEFVVDCCDLDKEFKSSSLMPGKRGKRLGQGATAEVRIMARKGTFSNEELVAVKEFRTREKDEAEEDYIKKIKSEYSIAKSLHHPNIVETVRLCTNRGRWNHVMEFCSHGELFTLVERKLFSAEGGYYSVADRQCFFKQLLRGVEYLHSHGIAHRDIKLENLLLNKEGHLKISDFGVAEVFSGEHPGLRAAGGECGKNMGEPRLSNPGICGSLPYIAPEVLEKNGSYDPRPLDVWSCAIVYLTMTFGGCPWQAAKTDYEYYARFKKGWDEWLAVHPDGQVVDGPDGHPKCGKLFSLINPPAIKRLLLKMLHPIPDKRITIREVLNTSCIKSIDCCCPDTYEDASCCIDTSKGLTKQPTKLVVKKYLHHHVPPKPENKIGKAFQHRFDMGDGWA